MFSMSVSLQPRRTCSRLVARLPPANPWPVRQGMLCFPSHRPSAALPAWGLTNQSHSAALPRAQAVTLSSRRGADTPPVVPRPHLLAASSQAASGHASLIPQSEQGAARSGQGSREVTRNWNYELQSKLSALAKAAASDVDCGVESTLIRSVGGGVF
jgi:hypothetical protein